MRFLPGRITLSGLVKSEARASNAGAVTVTSGPTTITALPSLDLQVGDTVHLWANVRTIKAAIAGFTQVGFQQQSGTAAVQWYLSQSSSDWRVLVPASDDRIWQVVGVVRCVLAGTIILELFGISAGGDSSVAAGAGQVFAWVYPGG